jgi:dTDP-4-dehydrorhamnose reductase
MRVLLTGAHGLLGHALRDAAEADGIVCDPLARPQLGDAKAMSALAARLAGYDVLIHAAANTNVEQCEADPAACYRDNYLLTESLAQAAAAAGVKLVFISSTGIYGTASGEPYREYDAAVPTTHHHRSKLLAEQQVGAASARNLIVRTGWLFGGRADNPKNFIARRLEDARAAEAAGGFIESNSEQFGVPCYSQDIAQRILAMARAGLAGTYNCVNSGQASRHAYVEAIVRLSGMALEVRTSTAASFKRLAQVSPNEMAENWKLDSLGWAPLPHWRASLENYLRDAFARGEPQ